MTWEILGSFGVSTILVALVQAWLNRRKNRADATVSITDAAEKALDMSIRAADQAVASYKADNERLRALSAEAALRSASELAKEVATHRHELVGDRIDKVADAGDDRQTRIDELLAWAETLAEKLNVTPPGGTPIVKKDGS